MIKIWKHRCRACFQPTCVSSRRFQGKLVVCLRAKKKRSCLPPKPLLVGAAGIYGTGVRHSVQCFKGTVHGAGEEKIQDGGKVEERPHSTSRSSFGKRATASRSQEKLKEIKHTSNRWISWTIVCKWTLGVPISKRLVWLPLPRPQNWTLGDFLLCSRRNPKRKVEGQVSQAPGWGMEVAAVAVSNKGMRSLRITTTRRSRRGTWGGRRSSRGTTASSPWTSSLGSGRGLLRCRRVSKSRLEAETCGGGRISRAQGLVSTGRVKEVGTFPGLAGETRVHGPPTSAVSLSMWSRLTLILGRSRTSKCLHFGK